MKKVVALFLCLLLNAPAFSQFANKQNTESQSVANASVRDEEDPDMPPFARGKLDKKTYKRLRAEHIKKLRGLNDYTNFNLSNPRVQAIRRLEEQKKRNRRVDSASLAASEASTETGMSAVQSGEELASLNETTWTEIGPAPIPNGQTRTITSAVSGRVTAIAIHPTNPDIVYVGTAQGGLYRTLDGGNSWTQLMDQARSLAIGAVAISPAKPTTVFVGTGEANNSCDSYFGVGLYRIDDAETAPVLSGPFGEAEFAGRSISKILVDPADGDANTIFLASGSGIGGIGCNASVLQPSRGLFRSTNAATLAPTFSKLNVATASGGNRSVLDMVFEPGNPNTLLATVYGTNTAGDGGIYRTTDAFAATPTFTRTLAIGSSTAATRINLAIAKTNSIVTVLAATGEAAGGTCSTYGHNGTLRRSTDGGATWSAPVASANGFCGGQCGYDIAVAVDPVDTNTIYLGGSAYSAGGCSTVLKRSTNGSTFAHSDAGLHADTHAITVAPSNSNIVYTGNDGGVWKSNDKGATWTSLNKAGFNATQFQSIAVHPTDPNFTIGGTQDNGTQFKKADGTWTRADYGDGGFALIDQNATDTTNVTMYHTYYNSAGSLMGFGRVTNTANARDDGWTFLGCGGIANGINCSDSAVEFYAPMALGPGNPNTLYYGSDRLYRSINTGTNMAVVSQQFAAGVAVTAIGISPQTDAVRIVGLENGKVFRTTTGATTMNDVTGAIPAKFIARAVVDPNNSNTAYVTLAGFGLAEGQHVWKTTNLNHATPTWTASGAGIPDVPVNAFVVDPANSAHLYAGTDIGVYSSTDGGATWTPHGANLPVVATFGMAIHNPSRTLRIATHGRGMWEIKLAAAPPPAAPAAPANLSATAASSSAINLAWTDSSANESNFKLERSIDGVNFTQIAAPNVNATSYADTGLSASTTYTYRIRATNAGGDSAYSNSATASTPATPTLPAAPTNLTGTAASKTQINLSWTDNSTNETGFRIERCTGTTCTNFVQLAQTAAGVRTYSNTGLSRNTSYRYRVRAYNATGDSAYSNTATIKTLR